MVNLSVNVNKIATLRNSRGGSEPSVLEAIDICIAAGAPGITIHPREDERHITGSDVLAIAAHLAPLRGRVELNVEGDPRPALMDRVIALRPDQCTLVPVARGEITSQAGWPADTPSEHLQSTITRLQQAGIRVSMFVDPDEAPVRWASNLGADRIELYTEPFAKAFARGRREGKEMFAAYVAAATLAHALGLGINAGHDLDLENLTLFRTLPHLDEVSIGHALITRALWVGLDAAVRDYLAVLRKTTSGVVLRKP
jgi:pyridoxine 5-phosphate synthase